ncbi:MAG: Hpt domain-containing protein [Flavobacteriales bacterium]|nr:Hpt domain-containing protein [Flavobacteriales bacterium]
MIKNTDVKQTLTSDILDLTYLNECFLGERAPQIYVITIFLEQTKKKIEELQNAIKDEDYSLIKKTAHFLKSSFSMMGLSCYDDISKLEMMGTQKEKITTISTLFKSITPSYRASIREFEFILKKLKS